MIVLRIAALMAASAFVWVVGASHVTVQQKLSLAAIVPGAMVSQPFGCSTLAVEPFDPFCPSHHTHTGVDLAAVAGTPVRAATEGGVRVGFDSVGCGLYVVEVTGPHVRVLYCHMSAVLVADGGSVTTGQVIGEVGATGLAMGAHLHFEVQVDRHPIDPAVWLSS